MSYQVLARKWRPSNFSQVAGQSHVLQSLINALDNNRLHHAYLFTGTRGVGKTTLARILAKCLNCEEGITSTPCESCTACTEINTGRFVDLIEVDAASRTKVDDTRELLDNVQYAPARGRFKVYLIDEVHMLSNHSFNALLKTLEEPPPHVKFLFATTDPQKLPVTILSRCLQFSLKNLSPELIQQYLVQVLTDEQVQYDEEALWQIAAAARGSMRDALTLTDQAIAFCEGQINAAAVIEMLGVPQHQQVIALLQGLANRDTQQVLSTIQDMAAQSPDYGNTLDSLLSAMHRMALAQVAPQAVDNSFGDRQALIELAAQFTPEDIQLYYQIGSKGRDELRLATDLRVAFEMLLLRMLIFSPRYTELSEAAPDSEKKKNLSSNTTVAEPSGKITESTESITPASSPAHTAASEPVEPDASLHRLSEISAERVQPQTPPDTDTQEETAAVTTATAAGAGDKNENYAELQSSDDKPDTGDTQPVSDAQDTTVERREEQAASSEPQQNNERIPLSGMDHESWLKVYFQLEASGIVANVLANTVWDKTEDNTVHLLLDVQQSAVYSEELNRRLEQSLGAYFDSPVTVQVTITSTDAETPAALSQRLRDERHAHMVREFENDANVQSLVQRFSATVAKETIAPRKD
jgi:DNA polymerase-3 subunit gamma/tau